VEFLCIEVRINKELIDVSESKPHGHEHVCLLFVALHMINYQI
jgi:hypothetical protein